MLFVLFLALTVFFYISYKTFAEDKKLDEKALSELESYLQGDIDEMVIDIDSCLANAERFFHKRKFKKAYDEYFFSAKNGLLEPSRLIF